MIVSEAGLDLIIAFEGFSSTLYDDPANNATIGYGILVHLGPYHRNPGECPACDSYRGGITEDQGKTLLRVKAQTYGDCMENATRVTLNQNQYDALTSFTYNVGCGGYVNSSVRSAVNGGGNVCNELQNYIHGSDGVVYPGLVRRRAAECQLYMTPVEEDGLTQQQYDEVKGLIGELLKSMGDLGKKVDDLGAIAWRDALRINALESKK